MTREARAAQERLPDRISIGVLARTFPTSVLDEAIEAAGVRELRYRRLPARLMIVFTLACWLFMRSGYGLVLSKLADAQALVGAGWGDWQVPWTGSITKAKAKIGAEPFRLLFARTAVPAGTVDTPGVFYAGLRVVTVDGFTLDLPDTDENAEFFGRGGNGSESKNPYPQLRALALAESGTRVLLAATYGPSGVGEQTLAEDLLPALGPGMLVLADRNFASFKLWRAVAATGAQLVWRMSASFKLPVLKVESDGTYLSELRPPRKKDGPPIRVRVVEYSVITTDEDGREISELFLLATTLLDVKAYPAIQVVLRSKTPVMVEQEFWAMLCVYQAIRDLISYAAPTGLDPGRVSFKRALEAAQDSATRAALSPLPN